MSLAKYDRLWLAQDGKCFYCGNVMLPITGGEYGKRKRMTASKDHLFPRVMAHKANKKVWACCLCNVKKADRQPTIEEYARFYCLTTKADQLAAQL